MPVATVVAPKDCAETAQERGVVLAAQFAAQFSAQFSVQFFAALHWTAHPEETAWCCFCLLAMLLSVPVLLRHQSASIVKCLC
jgi:hypothetical protein